MDILPLSETQVALTFHPAIRAVLRGAADVVRFVEVDVRLLDVDVVRLLDVVVVRLLDVDVERLLDVEVVCLLDVVDVERLLDVVVDFLLEVLLFDVEVGFDVVVLE